MFRLKGFFKKAEKKENKDIPDMQSNASFQGQEIKLPSEVPQTKNEIPPGYKKMTIFVPALQDFAFAIVPEDTPELTKEEFERYSSINPK